MLHKHCRFSISCARVACTMVTTRLRLVMLFALRYEKEGRQQIASLMAKLQELGMGASVVAVGCVPPNHWPG